MNRRTLIISLLSLPVTARLPGSPAIVLSSRRRYTSRSEGAGPVEVEVLLAPTERLARGWRNREAHDPFDGKIGEFYIADAHPLELPEDLPGTATTYETVVGAAAQEGIVHVGGFRRELFVWTVRVHGGAAEDVIRAGEAIAAMPLPDPMEVRLGLASLETLLPGPEVFGPEYDADPEG